MVAPMWLTGTFIFIYLIQLVLFIPLNALFLWLSTKLMNVKKSKFLTALGFTLMIWGIALVISLLALFSSTMLRVLVFLFLLFLWFPISWILLKSWYHESWSKSILVWLIWTVFNLIAGTILWFFFMMLTFLLGLGAMGMMGVR